MANPIYGASLWKSQNMESNLDTDSIAANSTTFAVGDPLTYSSGQLVVASATSTITGIGQKALVSTSNNTTVAQVQVPYIPVDETTVFRMGTNAALTGNATDPGTYYKLTGTTGAIQVDVASGVQTTTNRIVMIKKVAPMGDGNLQDCLVVFVRRPTETSV